MVLPSSPYGLTLWEESGLFSVNARSIFSVSFPSYIGSGAPDLLLSLERHAVQQGRRLSVLVQVNVSGELSKSGIQPSALPSILELVPTLRAVTVDGLMTIPPASENPEDARPFFRALRELRDSAAEKFCVPLPYLSMGMTHDMDVAVEEGATYVRVGTGIFGARTYT